MNVRVLFAIVLFVATLMSISGCTPTHQFIVIRDVPDSPSFVVIPANNKLDQVHFATEVEDAFISCGVKVLVSPHLKETVTETSIGKKEHGSDATPLSFKEADHKHTEYISGYAATEADYIVRTFQSTRQIKIFKNNTREILTIIYATDYKFHSSYARFSWKHKVFATLKRMGISARKPPEPPKLPNARPEADD